MNSATERLSDDAPDFPPNSLPFDESALDKLKGTYDLRAEDAGDAPVWCGCCTRVSRYGDWAAAGQCPDCREPLYARFLWSDLCRIKPSLPDAPPVGKTIAVYDF